MLIRVTNVEVQSSLTGRRGGDTGKRGKGKEEESTNMKERVGAEMRRNGHVQLEIRIALIRPSILPDHVNRGKNSLQRRALQWTKVDQSKMILAVIGQNEMVDVRTTDSRRETKDLSTTVMITAGKIDVIGSTRGEEGVVEEEATAGIQDTIQVMTDPNLQAVTTSEEEKTAQWVLGRKNKQTIVIVN